MTLPPSRAEILAALQDPQLNILASRVAVAMAAYGRALEEEARRRGSLEFIELPAPIDEVEAVALEIVRYVMREKKPKTTIKIKGDVLTTEEGTGGDHG
jgi:hypothetical protein